MKTSCFNIVDTSLIDLVDEAPTVLFVMAIYIGRAARFAPIATLRNFFAEAGIRRRRHMVQALPDSHAVRAEGCGPSCIFLVSIFITN